MRKLFTVPGTPQGKARPRVVTKGGVTRGYTPAKTVAYEQTIAAAYKCAFPCSTPCAGPVELKVTAYMPVARSWSRAKKAQALAEIIAPTAKPDADNILKAIADGLNGIAWEDDKQIVYAEVRKKYGATPRVEVDIWEAGR